MKIDDLLHGISTLVLTTVRGSQIQGTGFFFQKLGPPDSTKPAGTAQWREVLSIWLVTCRHVVLPKIGGQEVMPDQVMLHMRKIADNKIIWEPIGLDLAELTKRVKLHRNPAIDITIIRVDDLITDRIKSGATYMQWSAVGEENLPGNNNISAEVTDDVIVIGYPKGFYDRTNVFPIVKSGIIASRWGLNFNGMPVFLVDARLFPGSSGSIVITKPIDFVVVNGKPLYAKEKQFAFLGVYSGEPFLQKDPIELDDMTIIRKDSFNVGMVWYGSLVIDIIKEGIELSQLKTA
jgi:hypothetical protein